MEIAHDDFLTLEETEVLKDAFFEQVKARQHSPHGFWPRDAFGEIEALLGSRAASVGPLPVVLFSSVDQYIGALRAPADRILAHAAAVWKVVDEDLCMTTTDLEHGLCLEFNFYAEVGERLMKDMYELIAWGVLSP